MERIAPNEFRTNSSKNRIILLIVLIAIAGVIASRPQRKMSQAWGYDFHEYYTAAWMVRDGTSSHLYDEATANVDFQTDEADPSTVFAQTAAAHGIPGLNIYVMPPTLADITLPLTLFSTKTALIVWNTTNFIMLFSVVVMLGHFLEKHSMAWTCIMMLFATFYRPTIECFFFGQVAILLLFFVVLGLTFYIRGKINIASFLFALAIAIKLTPLIIVIPFIAWRDWKMLRNIALWCACLLALICIVNGREVLTLYFMHMVPAMPGLNEIANRTLGAMFYEYALGWDGGKSPVWLLWIVRLVSLLIICYASWLSFLKKGDDVSPQQRFEIACVFLLFSCCLAPVSWVFAYVMSIPTILIFSERIINIRRGVWDLVLLFLFLASITNGKLLYLSALSPLFGVTLGIIWLYRLRSERHNGNAYSY